MKKAFIVILVCFLFCGLTYLALRLFFHVMDNIHDQINEQSLKQSRLIGDIKTMYREYYKAHGKPPSKAEDLEPFANEHKKGFEAIKTGQWIIFWNTPISDNPRANGDRVLGYDKDLFLKSSMVMTANGSATQMSFEEYQREQEETTTLHQVGTMYSSFLAEHKRPAAKLEELEPYAEKNPKGFQAIKEGRWIILWNAAPSKSLKENFDIVIGYEKRTKDNVGWVLTADGSGTFMSSEYLADYMGIIPASHEIWWLYTTFCQDKKGPPMKLEELQPYADRYPKGFGAIQHGAWVVRWGTELTGDPKKDSKLILAHECHVPTTTLGKGGYVITADNFSERMGSYEFTQRLAGVEGW